MRRAAIAILFSSLALAQSNLSSPVNVLPIPTGPLPGELNFCASTPGCPTYIGFQSIATIPQIVIASATAANPMVLTLASAPPVWVQTGVAITISGATGSGCSGMNTVQTVSGVAGSAVTIAFNGTGCTYTASSGSVLTYWVFNLPSYDVAGPLCSDGSQNLSFATCSSLPVPDTTIITYSAADNTKQMRFDDSGITTGNTRVLSVQDWNGTLATVDHTENFTADQTFVNANLLTNGTGTIGSVGTFWANSYIQTMETNTLHFFDSSGPGYNYWLGFDSGNKFSMTDGTYQIFEFSTVIGTGTFEMFGNILPSTASTFSIGSPAIGGKPWQNGYFTNLFIYGGLNGCLEVAGLTGTVSATGTSCGAGSALPVYDTTIITENATDPTKQMRFNNASISTGQTRVLTVQDWNGALATVDHTETFTADQTFSSASILTNSTGAIGSISNFWANSYIQTMETNTTDYFSSVGPGYNFWLGFDASNRFSLTNGTYQIFSFTTVAANAGTMTMFGNILPSTSNLNIGSGGLSGTPWTNGYFTNLYITGLSAGFCLSGGGGGSPVSNINCLTTAGGQTITAADTFTAGIIISSGGAVTAPSGSNGASSTLACSGAQAVTGLTLSAGIATAAACGTVTGGSGTVTSIATSSPITGGTITTSGTIGCSTCLTTAGGQTISGTDTFNTLVVNGTGSSPFSVHPTGSGVVFSIDNVGDVGALGVITAASYDTGSGGSYKINGTAVINTSSAFVGAGGVNVNNVTINSALGGTFNLSGNMTVTGNFYNRSGFSSSGVSCSGVADGWSATTSDDYLVVCLNTGTRYRAALTAY